jgi:gamma-carbonic anhydrase
MRDEVQIGGIELPTGQGPLYILDGVAPRIASDAFIAPTAVVIGDVEVGPQSGIWFSCVLRGDFNSIRIGARTNIQDGTIVHVDPGAYRTEIGDEVTIGHGAIIHGCRLRDRAFVGMGAIVLDGCTIEEGGVLGAGALLPSGKVIGRNELWVDVPARFERIVPPDERAGFDHNFREYVQNAARFRAGLRPITPARHEGERSG